MPLETTNIIAVLFKVLIAFVVINCIVSLILSITHPKRMYKLLFGYWCSLLVVFVFQGAFQEGAFQVAMAYSLTMAPVTIMGMVAFGSVKRKFPLADYGKLYALAIFTAISAHLLGGDFTTIAMPLSLATAAPLVHSAFLLLYKLKNTSTRLQKFLGVLYVLIGVHAINFALFRMVDGAQLWGWFVAYASYDVLGILLPSIALEEAKLQESQKLEKMVEDRTKGLNTLNVELNKSLHKNETLLKVVLHDIGGLMGSLRPIKREMTRRPDGEQFARSLGAIEEILQNIKSLYAEEEDSKVMLDQTEIIECVRAASQVLNDKIQGKKLHLIINERLSSKAFIIANKTALTHSIFGNLIGHGVDLSEPGTDLVINLCDESGVVEVELQNKGQALKHQSEEESLSIVNSLIGDFGGEMRVESLPSKQSDIGAENKVKLLFKQIV